MKIGLFGNTNNYPFGLAQILRDLGHEVVLVVTSRELLHRPESRYPEFKNGYPEWILDAAYLSEWDLIALSPSLGPVLDILSNCDALVLNGSGPSLWGLVRRPAIALLTGSDLEDYANIASVELRSANWGPVYKAAAEGLMDLNLLRDFVRRQREGIREASAIRYFPRGLVPAGDAMLDELGVPDSKRVFLPAADIELVKPTPAPHNNPIRIFCATRLTWKLPIEPGRSLLDYKGSDIMVRGLGLFYRQTGVRLDIQLVRKGLHVSETEQLIAEEDLTDQVTWSDEMSLDQVWTEYARCDIVIEQLANSAIGGAGLNALAAGRPVIGNPRREMFEDYFGQPSPICQAKTPEEVCAQLKRLVFNAAEREKLCALGREYVEEHWSFKRAAETCLQRLQAAFELNKSLPTRNGTPHAYYLQKCYEHQQSLRSLQQLFYGIQQSLQVAQAEIEANRQSLQAAQAEIEANRQSLQVAQTEIEANRQSLQAAQAEIEANRQSLQITQAELEATRDKLARYENSFLIQIIHKIRSSARK